MYLNFITDAVKCFVFMIERNCHAYDYQLVNLKKMKNSHLKLFEILNVVTFAHYPYLGRITHHDLISFLSRFSTTIERKRREKYVKSVVLWLREHTVL